MYKGRSILNVPATSSGAFAGDTLALGSAGTIGAQNSNIQYALDNAANGFHAFEGNVSVSNGYYIGDGSLLSGIVSMPSDIVANSIASNSNVLVSSGTVALPSYAFTSNPSSGFYLPATGQVAVSTGGVETLRVSSGLLSITGNITMPQVGAPNQPGRILHFGRPFQNQLICLYGDISPATVDFYGFGIGSNTLRYQVYGGAGHGFYDASTLMGLLQTRGWTLGTSGTASAPAYAWTGTGATSGMFLGNAANGNVGISANGTQRLLVSNSAATVFVTGNLAVTSNLVVDGAITAGAGEIVLEDLVLDGAAGNAVLSTSSTGVIQTTEARLVSNVLYANGFSAAVGNAGSPSVYFGADTASGLFRGAVGQVSIAAGGIESTRFANSNVNVYGNLVVTQDITAFASDARLKTNFRIITESPLLAVQSLRGVRFDWRDDGPQPMRGTDVGLIAQDVSNVLPEAVCPAPFDDTFLTIRMTHQLTALLVEAVKELIDRVGALENNS